MNPGGEEVAMDGEWGSSGGSVEVLTDSTARFSSLSAGSFWVWWCRRYRCTPKDSTIIVVTPPVLQAVILTPSTASLTTGGTQQFSVSGQWSNGTTTAPAVTYSATGGSINAGGLYAAGSTAGSFRVIATQQGGTLADTSAVTITTTPPVLQAVLLTPSSASLSTGATQQFSVSGQWSNGATTAPAVTYSATGGGVTSAGLYTAGNTAGSFRVIAVQQGGTLADTSAVTLSSTPPVLQAVILTPSTASLTTGGTQQFSVSGQWSNGATTAPAVTYTATGGGVTSAGLYTAGNTAGSFRVIARQQSGTLADTSTVTLTTTPPVLQAVILTPSTASLTTGGAQQFSVSGQWSDGATTAPAVTYTATGGSISSGGFYAAGNTAGSFRVIAQQQSGSLADTSTVTVTQASGLLTGLDFPGNVNFPSKSPSAILTWNQARSGAAPMPAYPATYIWRAYPRANNNFLQSYWTFLFYARYETTWTQGEVPCHTYYGFHPWPDRETNMEHKWEIAGYCDDRTATSGAQGVPVGYNQWYQQVATAELVGNNEVYTYYFNWPNTTTGVVQWTHARALSMVSDPAIIIGDAPWNQGKEIPNAILRGYQFYDVVLTPAQIAQEIASPGSVRTPWYLNLNPTPTDVADKSGNGHNPAWVGSVRPGVWTGN